MRSKITNYENEQSEHNYECELTNFLVAAKHTSMIKIKGGSTLRCRTGTAKDL